MKRRISISKATDRAGACLSPFKRAASTSTGRSPISSRRGSVMVFALIALLVASMMIGSLLKTAGMSHRQIRKDEIRLQASLLADAGCERVRMLLQSQPDFSSGEWDVPAEQLTPNPWGHPDAVRITRQRRIR